MANDGVITQKDIIEEKALTIGKQYADNMVQAIEANKQFVESLKAINKLAQEFKGIKDQSGYITAKQQQALETQKMIDAIKRQEAAEISMNKIEQERIKTSKADADAQNKLSVQKQRGTKLTLEERIQLEISNKAAKQATLERLGLVGAYTKLNAARTAAKKTLLDLLAAENQDIKAIKEATKAFDALDKRVRAADHAVGDFHKTVGNYPNLKGFAKGLKDLAGAFGLVGGITAFAAILGDAYKTIKEFEQSLADLSSITGATGKDLSFLKNSAIDLGQTVEGGAQAVVEAYKLIAGAKPELLDNVKALNQVTEAAITLSQAAGMELPEAATALTDALNQFGAPAEEAQAFIDALANGAKFGSAEIPQLTESLLKFGAVARSSNINIKESAALVELLAENGLKGAEAGTALRNILLKISAPDALPKLARAEFQRLGISMETLKDQTIPVAEKLALLKPLLKDNASIVKVFGVENATAAINVLSHNDRLKELIGQMSEVGTAAEQAAIRMDTLNGKTELLKSTYDSFILSVGSGSGVVSDFFKFFIDGANGSLKSLIRLNTSWDDLFGKAAQEGSSQGVKTFQQQFNELIRPEISEKERKNIRNRIKEINDAIQSGYNDPALLKEKNSLLDRLGTGDETKIAISIGRAAMIQRKTLKEELKKTENELKDFNPYAINLSGRSGKDIKLEKERLIKAIAEQEQILIESQKKIRGIGKKSEVSKKEEEPPIGLSDKELKDALKRQKELNDALFELERQRLERIAQLNGEIVSDDKLKDDIRIGAAKNVNKAELDLIDLVKQHKLDADKFVLDEDKMNANQKLFIEREAANKIVDVNKKMQKDIDQIHLFDEASYTKSMEKRISRINENMNKELELENIRFKELGDLESLKFSEREKLTQDHENRIFEIKKKAALASLRAQADTLQNELDASDALPDKERLTAEKRQEIAEKLSKAKSDIAEKELEKNDKKNKKILDAELKLAEDIREISNDLANALGSLADAISERKLQNIEAEIDKNNEFYDKQIELAGEDENQKDLLEKEREKKNEILEKKKRKEQEKQAKFNKALAIAQAAINLGVAVTAALTVAPPASFAFAAITAAIAAVQLAAVIATPIPKYKVGRKGGKKEKAIINDGVTGSGNYVPEVVESKDGTAKIYEGKNRLVQLMEGDTVHKSVGDYTDKERKKLLNGVQEEGKKLNEFQRLVIVKDKRDPELINKIDKLIEVTRRNKPSKSEQKNVDLSHAFWKLKNQL